MIIKSFQDIPQFPQIHYNINMGWDYLNEWIKEHQKDELSTLNLNPDFQRGHIWTEKQQIAYIEYMLQGGTSGRHLYFNHPGWMSSFKGDFVLVDGLQRITAVQKFMHDEIKIFGLLKSEFTGFFPHDEGSFIINIAKLKTRKDVLNWYLLINTGGTPHSLNEIEKVKKLLLNEK